MRVHACAQSRTTFFDPVDCRPSGSTVHSMGSPGKNTGVGGHFLLYRIFPTLHLLHWQVDSLPLHTWEATY